MAGRGPTPKDPAKRVRRNADPTKRATYLRDPDVVQPALPTFYEFDPDGSRRKHVVQTHPPVVEEVGRRALAQDFTSVEWEYMLDTARVHNAIWRDGEMKLMAELRLRVAKVGATVEDRQRLRISTRRSSTPTVVAPVGSGASAARPVEKRSERGQGRRGRHVRCSRSAAQRTR